MHHLDDSSCPSCGYRRKKYVMSVDSEAPGLRGLWNGEGGPMMQLIAKAGTLILSALCLAEIIHLV